MKNHLLALPICLMMASPMTLLAQELTVEQLRPTAELVPAAVVGMSPIKTTGFTIGELEDLKPIQRQRLELRPKAEVIHTTTKELAEQSVSTTVEAIEVRQIAPIAEPTVIVEPAVVETVTTEERPIATAIKAQDTVGIHDFKQSEGIFIADTDIERIAKVMKKAKAKNIHTVQKGMFIPAIDKVEINEMLTYAKLSKKEVEAIIATPKGLFIPETSGIEIPKGLWKKKVTAVPTTTVGLNASTSIDSPEGLAHDKQSVAPTVTKGILVTNSALIAELDTDRLIKNKDVSPTLVSVASKFDKLQNAYCAQNTQLKDMTAKFDKLAAQTSKAVDETTVMGKLDKLIALMSGFAQKMTMAPSANINSQGQFAYMQGMMQGQRVLSMSSLMNPVLPVMNFNNIVNNKNVYNNMYGAQPTVEPYSYNFNNAPINSDGRDSNWFSAQRVPAWSQQTLNPQGLVMPQMSGTRSDAATSTAVEDTQFNVSEGNNSSSIFR